LNDEVLFYIGECYSHEGNWKSAIRYFRKAIRIEDYREEYYAALAEAYYQIGDHEQAAYMFKTSTEIAPDQSSYWIHYASYLMEVGQGDLALQVLDEAEENTVGLELLYCRVACLFSIGKRQKAKYYLGEALAEDFDMHIALFALSPDLQYDTMVLNMVESYRNDFSI
jgi:tetratricopeptide (TPR) repeat protein